MRRVFAIVLIVLGVAGLVWRGFSVTKEKRGARLGPIELTLTEKERVEVPVPVSVAAVAAGTLLLVLGRRRK